MPNVTEAGSVTGNSTTTIYTVPEGRIFKLSYFSLTPTSGNAISGSQSVSVLLDGQAMFNLNADKESIDQQFANPLEVITDIVLIAAAGSETFNWSLAGDWE